MFGFVVCLFVAAVDVVVVAVVVVAVCLILCVFASWDQLCPVCLAFCRY